MKTITIIGAGFSGTMTAVHLMRMPAPPNGLKILLIGDENELGKGAAYSTTFDWHKLNVVASAMSAFPDEPEHFVQWLSRHATEFSSSSFVPRKIYGDYIRHIFSETIRLLSPRISFEFINGKVTDITARSENNFRIFMAEKAVDANAVVLALGNFEPAPPKSDEKKFLASENYFNNPLHSGIAERISPGSDVLIIGTGLTMIDAVLMIDKQSRAKSITAISPHGYIPLPHFDAGFYPDFYHELKHETSVLKIFRIIRKHILSASSTGKDWRAVVDSIRPRSQEIWLGLSRQEKQRFIEHLRHIWGILRHRMPPECFDKIQSLSKSKKLSIIAGRIKNISVKEKKIELKYIPRQSSMAHSPFLILNADFIINCTGPQSDYESINNILLKNLISRGLLCNDELSQGIKATSEGCLIGRDTKIIPGLFTLGPTLKGILWETTAVPEIRLQALQLAKQLLAK